MKESKEIKEKKVSTAGQIYVVSTFTILMLLIIIALMAPYPIEDQYLNLFVWILLILFLSFGIAYPLLYLLVKWVKVSMCPKGQHKVGGNCVPKVKKNIPK